MTSSKPVEPSAQSLASDATYVAVRDHVSEPAHSATRSQPGNEQPVAGGMQDSYGSHTIEPSTAAHSTDEHGHAGGAAMVGRTVHGVKAVLHGVEEAAEWRAHAHSAVSTLLKADIVDVNHVVRSLVAENSALAQALGPDAALKSVLTLLQDWHKNRRVLRATRHRLIRARRFVARIERPPVASPVALFKGRQAVAALEALVEQQVSEVKAMRSAVYAARETLARVGTEISGGPPRSTSLPGALRAFSGWTRSPRMLKTADYMLHNRATQGVEGFLENPKVKLLGNALIAGAVVFDMYFADREHGSRSSNAVRVDVTGGLYTAFYTAPIWTASFGTHGAVGLARTVPGVGLFVTATLLAEGLFWDAHHVTGVISGAAQALGMGVDYLEGGAVAGDRSAAALKQEIENNAHGGVAKLAMLLTLGVAENGALGYAERVVDYYSNVDFEQFTSDYVDVWTWAF